MGNVRVVGLDVVQVPARAMTVLNVVQVPARAMTVLC